MELESAGTYAETGTIANLRAKQDIVNPKLKSLQLFNTPEAIADRGWLQDELRNTRHRITASKGSNCDLRKNARELAEKSKTPPTATCGTRR